MLSLTRNVNQRIFINDKEIVITIASVNGENVKIGIEAPRHIQVQRAEKIEGFDLHRSDLRP